MSALTLRMISVVVTILLAIPAEALAALPFQDVMKGYGPPVVQEANAIPLPKPRPSIRYKARQKAPSKPVKRPTKVAAAKAKKPVKAAPEPKPVVVVIPLHPGDLSQPINVGEFGGFMLEQEVIDALPKFIVAGVIAAQAKDYLIRTATTGTTMMMYGRKIVADRLKQQGVSGKAFSAGLSAATKSGEVERVGKEFAINMLHDVFAIKLARSVKQGRDEGIKDLGIMSAFRGPELGVGGFGDKTMSWHAAGLAGDMKGIDSAEIAKKWQRIANRNGLYLPYGPNNRAERNHTQLLMLASTKQIPAVHKIIVAAAKKKEPVQERVALWRASGIKEDAIEPTEVVQIAYVGGGRRHVGYRHHGQRYRAVRHRYARHYRSARA